MNAASTLRTSIQKSSGLVDLRPVDAAVERVDVLALPAHHENQRQPIEIAVRARLSSEMIAL